MFDSKKKKKKERIERKKKRERNHQSIYLSLPVSLVNLMLGERESL